MNREKIYTVGQIALYMKNMFAQDFVLSRVGIRGEVSNCKYHTSGHIYFSLKDSQGTLACVMFASDRRGLTFRLEDGLQVVVRGSVGFYERDGRCQLYAREVTRDGAGALYERFLALRRELEEMGMFAAEYKKPLPFYARTIGVVTAPTGAAVRDIINISLRRNPWVRILLYPAKVQGEGSAESICEGIRQLDAVHPDVMIVGRGGGSIEDLWSFNEESVARAIFECETPVISAVGHETDTTIADLVADLRAPTPSAAAELAVCDVRQLLGTMDAARERMNRTMHSVLVQNRQYCEQFRLRLLHASPEARLTTDRQHAADLGDRLENAMARILDGKKHELALLVERMKRLSPLDRLKAGFAYLSDDEGKRITLASQVKEGEYLDIWLSDGRIRAKAEQIIL